MKIRTIIFTLLPALALTVMANAQQTTPDPLNVSLKQAQDYALKNNISMKNAQIDLDLAKKKIWETTAIGLPQINAQGNYQHLFQIPVMSFPRTVLSNEFKQYDPATGTGTTSAVKLSNGESIFMNNEAGVPISLGVKDNATLDVTLSQIIFSGEYLVGLQASKAFYQISERAKEKAEYDTRESIANSYNLALMLEENEKILQQSLDNLNKMLIDMKAMYKQGFIENTDVDQIELTTLNLSNAISSVHRQIQSAYDLLKFQMGIPYQTQLTLTDKLDTNVGTITLESISASQFNVKNNINYKMLETQEQIGKLNLMREKSTFLPNLAAFYRHSEKWKKPQFDFAPKDVAGVTINIPILSSGQRITKVRERELELLKIQNAKENATQGLQLEYVNAVNDLSSAFEKYQKEKKNIDLTKRIYDKTIAKYKEGLSTSMDITNTQSQYLTAQSNYFNAMYALISAKTKLDKLNNNL